MKVHLRKEFRFEASHQLPTHDGKCANLHGHSWVLNVWFVGEINTIEGSPKEGMALDYSTIKAIIQPIINMLDHHHLGTGYVLDDIWLVPDESLGPDFPGVPTSENLLLWIADEIQRIESTFNWNCLALNETCTSEARLYATDYALGRAIEKAEAERRAQEISDGDVPF